MRHNEGGMSRERRMEVYDHMRCKARLFCNVSLVGNYDDPAVIRMTLLMRTGPRSFKNDSAVTEIFQSECHNVQGCRLVVAYSNNLTFCQQVSPYQKRKEKRLDACYPHSFYFYFYFSFF